MHLAVCECLWVCRIGCFRHSSLVPETMGIWFSMWNRTRWPTLRNTWSRVRTWSKKKKEQKIGLKVAFALLFTYCLNSSSRTLPVHVDQPAAGGAQWLPPYHWVHTDQQQSCSLWPGNPHCRWEGTRPALFLTWERHKVTWERMRESDISRQTHLIWFVTDRQTCTDADYQPAMKPSLFLDQGLDPGLGERSGLFSSDLRLY